MQAEDEIGLPQDILEKENFDWELHWYSIDMRLNIVWSLNLIALILLGFFEVSKSNIIQKLLSGSFSCIMKFCFATEIQFPH